jgi:integrase
MMTQHPLFKKAESRKHKDSPTRITTFLTWLEEQGIDWRLPQIDAYRDYLLKEKKLNPGTVASYVSAVKRQYRRILNEGELQQFTEAHLAAMRAATDIHAGQPEYRRELQVTHLTQEQIENLLKRPNISTKTGLRDTIIMALILFTGISEAEVCELQVKDLAPGEDGGLVLKLPKREVTVATEFFYNSLWIEDYLSTWLRINPIHEAEAFVFRGFFRGGNVIRKNKMNPNAIHDMMRLYTEHDTEIPKFTVLDLRRTYARRLYDNDVPINTIRENLGFASNQTVIGYVGLPDREERLGSDKRGSGGEMLYYLQNRVQF